MEQKYMVIYCRV